MHNINHSPLFIKLSNTFNQVNYYLFPNLREAVGPLDSKQKEFISVCSTIELESFQLTHPSSCRGGRPRCSRISLLKAFIAKAVNNLPTTKSLHLLLCNSPAWRILCGWDENYEIPSEATFSRGFAELAESHLPEEIHKSMIKNHLGKEQVITGNNSIDSTEIIGREKSAVKYKNGIKVSDKKKKSPRRTAEEKRNSPPPEPKRIELQGKRTLDENKSDLPAQCDFGSKRNSKGKFETWCGFKLHLSTTDAGIPTAGILTSASVHDSQVAIPLIQMNQERLYCSLYDVMDSAYDAEEIKNFSMEMGHVPIIDPNPRGRKIPPQFNPAQKIHYKVRSVAERTNAELKDSYGGRQIRVRGAAKVMCHLMFGVIAITAKHLLGMLPT